MGQTGGTLNIRYREHIQAIRNNNSNSGYLNRIINSGYSYGTERDTTDIIKIGREDYISELMGFRTSSIVQIHRR
jgi:hypothetical protein